MINIIGNAIGAKTGGGAAANLAFEFTVDTTQSGTSAADQFTIPITSATPYDISTSDGHSITGATGATTLTFSAPGTYTVKITDSCEGLKFDNGGDKLKLLDISNWGVFTSTVERAFYGCSNMTCSAVEPPLNPQLTCRYIFAGCVNFNGAIGNWDVSGVTDFSFCFNGCSSFDQNISSWDVSSATVMPYMFSYSSFNNGGDPGINNWNTSNVTGSNAMNHMFRANTSFNQPIGNWDVSGVTRFNEMFHGATSFNQDISSWNTSAATDMSQMLRSANSFNQNIGSWDTSLVTNMTQMFYFAGSFNNGGDPSINNWNTSNVAFMHYMFSYASVFNQPIGNWDVSSVTGIGLQSMFQNATIFNQDLSTWNVTSNVTSLSSMFANARAFNYDISGWDVSGVTNMAGVFQQAYDFNQDISGWDTSNVGTFYRMFRYALDFNQPLGSWNTSSATNMDAMFENTQLDQNLSSWDINQVTLFGNFKSLGAPLSTANYDALLFAWEAQVPQSGITISFGNAQYTLGSAAETARTSLISTYGWTITDGGGVLTNESYLVASYNFDSNFTDYTGNHPLTAIGSVTAGTAGGKVSNCSDFNGTTSDYLTAADSDDFSFTNGSNDLPFSVSMWVNFDAVSNAWFMDKRASGNDEWQITYYLGKLNMALFSAGGSSVYLYGTYTVSLSASTWYHIAFTYDGSETFAGINFYLNGVNQTLTDESVGTYAGMNNGTATLRVGTFTSGFAFNGKMDEAHIWKNRELTAAEVTDIYNTENAGNSILPSPYLLNNYGGAAAAYSLRDLSSSTTNVVRVRRSSDNTEQDFTSTQVTDGTLTTFVGSGATDQGYVTIWYDQSGNAENAVQATTSDQPKIINNGSLVTENGKPAVLFGGFGGGTGTKLEGTTTYNQSVVSMTSVYTNTSTGSDKRPFGIEGSGAGLSQTFAQAADNTLRYDGSFEAGTLTATTNTQLSRYSQRSTTQQSDFIKNVQNISVSTSKPNIQGVVSFGKVVAGNNFVYSGTIQEAIIWNSDQSSNRTGIESNINSYYTIY